MHVEAHPRDRYPNDARQGRMFLAGLTGFAILTAVLAILAVFSPRACS